jgi:SWIM zinc finger
MPTPWRAEQVLALAPDAASAAAGRKLSAAASWSQIGCAADPAAVWGQCQGSGKNPYQTVVDLAGPAYKCSCPSRKFPCKHAVGLLLLWSSGGVPSGASPDWAAEWLTGRTDRAAKPHAPGRDGTADSADPQAARKRAEQRAGRVAAGLDELDRWLTDQIRTGLSGAERGGYAHFETVAARMVDAQAPALASVLRRLPAVAASGDGWHGRLLEELAALRLTVAAHRRVDQLPADLAATVRSRIGYPVAREDVLAGPPTADRWQVLGHRDGVEDRLTSRRVWLRGEATGRAALVLSFAATGQALDSSLVPGTSLDADLHFYPGAGPLRALVGARRGEPRPLEDLTGSRVADAYAQLGTAVAADPWVTGWPVVLDAVVPVPGKLTWLLTEKDGNAVPLRAAGDAQWRLLAVSGGYPVTVAGELTERGLRPLSVRPDAASADGLVLL